MPEDTAAVLDDALTGKTLTRCDIRVPRYAGVDLAGQRVDEVVSRGGKHLFIRVGPASIHSHLKMDGSWRIGRRPVDHRTRIILEAGSVRAVGIDLGTLEALDRWREEEAAGIGAVGSGRAGRDRERLLQRSVLCRRPVADDAGR